MTDTDQPVEVLYRKPLSPEDPKARVPAFAPSTTTLPAGYVHEPGAVPVPAEIVVDRDVAVTLRDGTVIYTDVFRPAGGGPLPALVAWAPYGKQGGSLELDDFPLRAGVPKGVTSGLERFEGPDPAYWCPRGYAIVHPDPRGIGRSGGNMAFWGRTEGQDGADLVEWIAEQAWSNGRVGLTGNSWLAIAQWFIAAERPPHLTAIAPWEGVSDFYRETSLRGGIPDPSFNLSILDGLSGQQQMEDTGAMLAQYPLMNEYWADKVARLDEIDVPAYVVTAWTNLLHTQGSLNGFRRISSSEKWLRVHNTHEWADYYTPAYVEELRRFFDRYLHDIPNGWESTPRVRVSVLDPVRGDDVNRPIASWPPQQEHTTRYLDAASNSLTQEPPAAASVARYTSTDRKGRAVFDLEVTEDVELLGYPSLRLWVSSPTARDMDLFVEISRLDRRGRQVVSRIIPIQNRLIRAATALVRHIRPDDVGLLFFAGPTGRLRVSHRGLDAERSTPTEPYLTHASEQPVEPGEIVPVDIGLWPVGMRWHAGDTLRLIVSGFDPKPIALRGLTPPRTINSGEHLVHTGGPHPSALLLPLQPVDGPSPALPHTTSPSQGPA